MKRSVQVGLLAGAALVGVLVAVGLTVPDWRVRLGLEPPAEDASTAEVAGTESAGTERAAQPEQPVQGLAGTEAPTSPVPSAPAGGQDEQAADGADDGKAAADAEAVGTDRAPGDQLAAVAPGAEGGTTVEATSGPVPASEEPDTGAVEESEITVDIVRVDPEGEAVVAGRTRPGARVEVLIDGNVVGSTEADAAGNFVTLPSLGQSDQARTMQLRVVEEDGAGTEADEAGAPVQTAAAPATGTSEGESGDESRTAEISEPSRSAGLSAPIVILPNAAAGEAPLLVVPGREEVALLQPGEADLRGVVLDRITYRPGGEAVASGRARSGHAVRVYANAVFVADVQVTPGGDWQLVLPRDVAEDAKLLRFDEISADGDVVSRVETPFNYDNGSGPVETRQRKLVVQRGDNLWRIAEQHYGEGLRYSVIFSANSELIRDPDLIYPGQVFSIPELVAAE